MTPAEWAAELERRAVEAERVGATAPLANTYRALAVEASQLDGTTGKATSADRLLKAEVVARVLRCSVRYVYANAAVFPFTVRIHGKTKDGSSTELVRFSKLGLQRYLARRAA